MVRVLVIGSGAREHALVLSLRSDPQVTSLACAPGNPGIAEVADVHDVVATDPMAVAELAEKLAVDLVVVGPEAPLVAGVADAVRATGIACFGPSQAAAQLEGSKTFAKSVMERAGVPTARARTCENLTEAAQALGEFGAPFVVKDDALAAGKGVVVTTERDAALAHADSCDRVVIEEFLDGPEVSLFVVTDGDAAIPLLPAQDFKRIGDDDTGPNTGGMGAYAPLPWVPDDFVPHVMERVVHPVLAEMRDAGTPFSGLLYCGLVITTAGPKVIEFNARFGDPETQPVLALLETPLAGLLMAAATGKLADHPPLYWRQGAAVTIVLASAGYPESARAGDPISIDRVDEGTLTHAGTGMVDGELVTTGGRVLSATAVGNDLAAARDAAYRVAATVSFNGMQLRHDIAEKAITGDIVL